MGLLDNYTGIGMSPRPRWRHQTVLANMLIAFHDEMGKQGLILLPEATLTSNWNDLAPDLVTFDTNHYPCFIMEITTHTEPLAIFEKYNEVIARFPDAECWTYDYEHHLLYLYSKEHRRWVVSTEYELYSSFLENPIITYLS